MLEHVFKFDLIYISSLIGSIAFAINGFIEGLKKNLDIVGLFFLAMLTANGGGVIRDIMLNKTPEILLGNTPSALTNDFAFILVALVTVMAIIINYLPKPTRHYRHIHKHILIVSDSLGLAAFSITGALMAIESNLNLFGVMTIAFISSVGGGIIRDILINQEPLLLKSGCLGVITFLSGGTLFALDHFHIDHNLDLNIIFVFIVCSTLQLIGHYSNCHAPRL